VLPLGDAEPALFRGLAAAIGDALLELIFFLTLVRGGQRLIVARHQAAVG